MSVHVVLLLLSLLLVFSGTHGSHFYGSVATYYPRDAQADGSLTVVLRYRTSFRTCGTASSWSCTGNCGSSRTSTEKVVDDEQTRENWCQKEANITRYLTSNGLFTTQFASAAWVNGIRNGVSSWKVLIEVELRNRSDTRKPNSSPQTTILPAVSVPSNCHRDFDLLAFDPDGDEVRCRYAVMSECVQCNPATVVHVNPNCTLSFKPTLSTNQGLYAVQLMVEDFPRRNITLTHTDGSQEKKTPTQAISKIPLQFVLKVDPEVSSCTEGVFLPKFLAPTPENRARLHAEVNRTLSIVVKAKATNATISDILFSGPHDVVREKTGPDNFTLKWTPSEEEDRESHPVCFVVKATSSSGSYYSNLRCVIVSVGETMQFPTDAPPIVLDPVTNYYVLGLSVRISSLLSQQNLNDVVIHGIKDRLISLGLPPSILLQVVRSDRLGVPVVVDDD